MNSLISSAVRVIPVLIEMPLILVAVIARASLLWPWFFAFTIEFLEQVVFAHFFNIHGQLTLRQQLNIFYDHRVIQRLLVPVTIQRLHQLAQVDDGLFS